MSISNYSRQEASALPSPVGRLRGRKGTYNILVFLCVVGNLGDGDSTANRLLVLGLTCAGNLVVPRTREAHNTFTNLHTLAVL